jgi:uncharacterized membrane protein YiaA
MPSKQLMGVWIFLDFCLLVSGIISLVFSIVWQSPDLLRDIIVSKADLTAGLVLGIMLIGSFLFSIPCIIQKNHVVLPLTLFKWLLFLDGVVVFAVGSFVWFFTLNYRNSYHAILAQEPDSTIIALQDVLQCCGYFNSSDLVVIGGTFCANETFVTVTNNATQNFCVTALTDDANYTLTNIFTSVYGFMAVVMGLGMATWCVVNKRLEEERFKRIDAKRGGRGFV